MRVFFDEELNAVATFWQVFRRDGVTLGFTSHDRDLVFAGIRHLCAPGFTPAAIRTTSQISDDSAEVEGVLSHDAISEADLSAGLYDGAAIRIGAVDWENLEYEVLYSGQLGRIEDDKHGFSAQLKSAKVLLEQDLVPRTSPTCRAKFCGPGCGLSALRFTTRHTIIGWDEAANRIQLASPVGSEFVDGEVRMLGGPQVGIVFGILAVDNGWLTLDRPIAATTQTGTRIEVLEGCDHTVTTCDVRFANARNFRGEPFLPGNDLLARYGRAS